MNIATEETGTAQAAAEKPKAGKKARLARHRAHVAPKKEKAAKKGSPATKAPKAQNGASVARDGNKAAKILDLLKRPKGATLAEIMKVTDWQAHSVRGFLSTAGKKHGLKIESTKNEDSERIYKIVK